jgi:aminoglycoside phosphotransferase (APT) family kinase protein
MHSEILDQTRPVRSGEELDLPKLEAFLKTCLPELNGPLSVEQFPKGYSNLTYLIRVGRQEMVLRRPPFGAKIKTAHDMGREYRILSHIHRLYPKVPRPLAYCEDESVMGAPFYVMERVTGIILRSQPPAGLELTPTRMRQLSQSFIENLVEIHALDYQAAGLGDLGKPNGYITRQIEGWGRRYHNARTDDISEMEQVAVWLREHLPPESGACLIHNDYKYDNLVLDPACAPILGASPGQVTDSPWRVKAVLDWEMATLGDPLMDLGSTLGYWVDADDPPEWQQQSFGITNLPGNFSREQLAESYSKRSGRSIENPVFYHAYGLFKIAVIVQQIYARYKQGLTKDERFGRLIHLVRAASRTALLGIEKNRISRLAL